MFPVGRARFREFSLLLFAFLPAITTTVTPAHSAVSSTQSTRACVFDVSETVFLGELGHAEGSARFPHDIGIGCQRGNGPPIELR